MGETWLLSSYNNDSYLFSSFLRTIILIIWDQLFFLSVAAAGSDNCPRVAQLWCCSSSWRVIPMVGQSLSQVGSYYNEDDENVDVRYNKREARDMAPQYLIIISRWPSGEAYFMCAATLITPTVTIAKQIQANIVNKCKRIIMHKDVENMQGDHLCSTLLQWKVWGQQLVLNIFCSSLSFIFFRRNLKVRYEWWCWLHRYIRLGNNYIAQKDPSEQTFQVFCHPYHKQWP